jgi:hypothetical protein
MQGKERRSLWGRRGFLRAVGASALGTAMVVFGSPGRADAAYKVFCCNLEYQPTISYETCRNSSNYTWVCTTATKTCLCCEQQNSQGYYVASAYKCMNV